MKKFLIIIIFLIPVIVIVAIQGTSVAIDAWAPEVNAESVEIRDEFNEYIGGGKVVIPRFWSDGSDGFTYIYINVYPKVAYSDEVFYVMSEEDVYDGVCTFEKIEKTKYKITAKKRGDVLLKVYSATNDNAYKMLNIYITSEVVTDLSIYTDCENSSEKIEESQVVDYVEDLKLFAHAYPAEAIGTNFMQWESSDDSIATVDQNGKITAESWGRVKITATVKDKTGREHFTFVYVDIAERLLRKNEVFINKIFFETTLDENGRRDFIRDNFVIPKKDKEDKESIIKRTDIIPLVESSDNKMVYQVLDEIITINYVEKNEIELVSMYLKDVYIENGGYTLIARYKDFLRREKIPDVTYNVSDATILAVEDNKIKPKKEGKVYIYAQDNITGAVTHSVELNVKKRIISFQLNYSNFDNLRGIKQERVWGTNWLDENGNKVNKFKLDFDKSSVYPETNYVDLFWEIDNTELASVDQEGTITFYPESVGQVINLKAIVLVHGIKTKLSRSYTFAMAKEEVINVYSIEELEIAYGDEMNKSAVAFQNDILIADGRRITATNSIFGNGYLVYFVYPDEEYRYSDSLMFYQPTMNSDISKLTIENFTIQCDDNFEFGKYKTAAIHLYDINVDSNIRYIIARNSWVSLSISRNKAISTVEGCILGISGFAAVYFDDDYTDEGAPMGTIILRNLVLKFTECASIVTAPYSIDTNETRNYVPNIQFEGFFDSYNWKKVEALEGILNTVDLGPHEKYRDLLKILFNKIMATMLKEKPYCNMVYTDEKGQKWVSMNMFAVGLSEHIDPDSFDLSGTDELEIIPFSVPLGKTLDKPCYLLTYKFDEKKGPLIKPKDVCPENELLFNRLRTNEAE